MAESSTPPRKIQNLQSFTVQIRHIKTQAIVGTGFVVSEDGLIATCAHVVVAAGVNPRCGKIPSHWELIRQSFFASEEALQTEGTVTLPVYFPQARLLPLPQRTLQARVAGCFHDYDDDIVLLKLEADDLPEGVGVALVAGAEESVDVADERRFRSYGYRRLGNYQGLQADGAILGMVEPPYGRIMVRDPLQLRSSEIDSGMSGAAVLDVVRDRVVGIIAETSDIRTGADRDTSFAVDYAVVQRLPDLSEASLEVSLTQPDRPTPETRSDAISAASPGVKPVALSATLPPERFDLKRAPKPLDEWVGRGELLQNLDQDWDSADHCITGLIGFGGEGKSSLARHWVDQVLKSGSLKPDGVFWWGFYDDRDIDQFFETLLRYLEPNIDLQQFASSSAKVAHLKTTLHRSRHRYVFMLDGLEVLQHPEGDDYGLFTSVDLKNWLRDFAEATHSSFCLITTRAPLLDLIDYRTYTHREVDHLSENEGVELLQKLGVKGNEPELRQVVRQWGGYALVLSLLGSYLVDHCNGDIWQLPTDLVPTATEAKYDRVSRVLRRYNEVLKAEERELLKNFSAFRLPVPEQTLTLLLPSSFPEKSADTAPAQEIVQRLVNYRILKYNTDNATYTTHPLIRDYYLKQLNQDQERSATLHRQIADFYLATAGDTPEFPTLADLAPLIEAVHHRCRAEDYDEADEIVWVRINKRDRAVLTHQLGAYDTELTLLQDFFPEGDTTQLPLVSSSRAQSWILNEIGLCLMHLGRLGEVAPFYERYVSSNVDAKDWLNASTAYQNLVDLYASLGNLPAAVAAAESALTFALQICNEKERKHYERSSLAYQGWVAHLQGNLDLAHAAFQQSEQLEQQIDSGTQYLYGLAGILYTDHLCRQGDTDYARRIAEANRVICEQYPWQNDLSICHCQLGALDATANLPTAQTHYNEALHIARNISNQNVLIGVLLARGRWAAQRGEVAAADSDLDEALGCAVAGGYRIYEADIRVALAWMHRAKGNFNAAQREAERAQRMSQAMGYYWGQQDAAEVLKELATVQDGQQT
jgi:tetratricopeptide (TPR) repeat protein